MATKRGKSKSKTIGWGLIGSGGFAEHTFAPALKEARGAELRAVLAPNRSEADAFCRRHKIDSGYDDLAEFVAEKPFKRCGSPAPTICIGISPWRRSRRASMCCAKSRSV